MRHSGSNMENREGKQIINASCILMVTKNYAYIDKKILTLVYEFKISTPCYMVEILLW